ncbi:zinc fingers and homeoboxes protein 2 [Hyperolius riggenbachi]|uniref:zinc fingers and homeoboxes protein 2 n=1 Tax=Hyperolius riggenbachi TaxID=752182 RepID=UPI0035A38A44
MASKRKSTTPCMVRASEVVDQDDQDIDVIGNANPPSPEDNKDQVGDKEKASENTEMVEEKPPAENQSKRLQGGYECKYCPYVTQNLNEFTEHVDMQHPNVILNPLYVCAECNFTTKKYDSLSDHNSKNHPGENNFKLKLMKRNNQTILEQSIEGSGDVSSSHENAETDDNGSGISIPKMPIIKLGKSRLDGRRSLRKNGESLMDCSFGINSIPDTNGISDALAHVMPSVQLPPNIHLLPKVAVPLNSNKYNSALDTNATLISSFNKFPYPTQAELSWLTAASKHPEEQIRIWFATQRLKHGISWSPEEVEEARKKMFNGTIQSIPQTFTVLPAPLTTTAKIAQPIIQTAVPCQFISQPGLVLTQVSNTPAVTVSSIPTTISTTLSQTLKRTMQSPQEAPEPKRQNIRRVPSPAHPRRLNSMAVRHYERKKTHEQIALLKASFVKSQYPDDAEVNKLIDFTGLTRTEIKKWFSDHRYRTQKGLVNITSETLIKDRMSGRTRRPYHYRNLGRKIILMTDDHIQCLEDSFLKSPYPTQAEIDRLRSETKLSRREIDLWFSDRRKMNNSVDQEGLDPVVSENDGLLNGTTGHSGVWSQSPSLCTSKQDQVHLLKSTFARTMWPSPQEYDQLAVQTGLVRTEIVKWFKDNRCVLRTGSLSWMEQYRKNYERSLEERKKYIKMVAATKTGKDILIEYFQEYGQLYVEDLDLLILKSKMNSEEVRECFGELQEQASLDQLDCNDPDEKYETGSESKDWNRSLHDDEEVISDGADSWSQTGQDNLDEPADFDYENTNEDSNRV